MFLHDWSIAWQHSESSQRIHLGGRWPHSDEVHRKKYRICSIKSLSSNKSPCSKRSLLLSHGALIIASRLSHTMLSNKVIVAATRWKITTEISIDFNRHCMIFNSLIYGIFHRVYISKLLMNYWFELHAQSITITRLKKP